MMSSRRDKNVTTGWYLSVSYEKDKVRSGIVSLQKVSCHLSSKYQETLHGVKVSHSEFSVAPLCCVSASRINLLPYTILCFSVS
jgi:hypothetical protein